MNVINIKINNRSEISFFIKSSNFMKIKNYKEMLWIKNELMNIKIYVKL